jgi:hypothetical protein
MDRMHQWTLGAEASSEVAKVLYKTRVQVNTPNVDFTGSAFGLTPSTWVVITIENH